MKTLVVDVAAESGGALSVLNDFYNDFRNDPGNDYVFVISRPKLDNCQNIKVLRYPWIKKSWLHRLYFDFCKAARIASDQQADQILSLQNMIVPFSKINQTLYLHNSLPFVEYRYRLSENVLLWTYQNIISKGIFMSVRHADHVIVQSKWMKEACVSRIKADPARIEIRPPKINIVVKENYHYTESSHKTFFYPASAYKFKNHAAIIKACMKLKAKGIDDYKVILTITGSENKDIAALKQMAQHDQLPIEFIGSITREEVFSLYARSVLLFPSLIESSPLPLSEARLHQDIILASDYPFSREALSGYDNVTFFNPLSSDQLADAMLDCINGSLSYEKEST